MAEAEAPRSGRTKLWFIFILFVILLAVIAYLAGQLNAHRYFLVQESRSLVVHRGAPFPFVTRPFVPRNDSERIAYAPILLSARDTPPGRQAFDDRAGLDHGIFVLLHKRLEEEFYGGRVANMERVQAAMQRISQLTGLSDEDRQNLRALSGDYAYVQARDMVEGLPQLLRRARHLCDQAETEGSGKLGDPRQLAAQIARWSQVFSQAGLSESLQPTTRFSGPTLGPAQPQIPAQPSPQEQEQEPKVESSATSTKGSPTATPLAPLHPMAPSPTTPRALTP